MKRNKNKLRDKAMNNKVINRKKINRRQYNSRKQNKSIIYIKITMICIEWSWNNKIGIQMNRNIYQMNKYRYIN